MHRLINLSFRSNPLSGLARQPDDLVACDALALSAGFVPADRLYTWQNAPSTRNGHDSGFANGVVYVGCYDHNIYALDATTGAKLWSFTTGNSVHSSPAVVNGVVYVGSDDCNIYALNAITGAKLWSFTTGLWVGGAAAVVNGVVYMER